MTLVASGPPEEGSLQLITEQTAQSRLFPLLFCTFAGGVRNGPLKSIAGEAKFADTALFLCVSVCMVIITPR